eukprot:9532685-Alexandrium_andersonii.AAC.1
MLSTSLSCSSASSPPPLGCAEGLCSRRPPCFCPVWCLFIDVYSGTSPAAQRETSWPSPWPSPKVALGSVDGPGSALRHA